MERRGTPSEWELREIRGIRLLKSANAFKCHNRSLYGTAGRHIVPIVPFDYKIRCTSRWCQVFNFRHSNAFMRVKILYLLQNVTKHLFHTNRKGISLYLFIFCLRKKFIQRERTEGGERENKIYYITISISFLFK